MTKTRRWACWVGVAVLWGWAGLGCQKDQPSETPESFDPAVDGVAVAPLPPLDPALARNAKLPTLKPAAAPAPEAETPAPPAGETAPPAATPPAPATEPGAAPAASGTPAPAVAPALAEPNTS